MKQVLVTGGAGFIGSNFVRYLLQSDEHVFIANLDALSYAGSLENLRDLIGEERHHFIQGNICDRELVDGLLKKYQIDTIVNFAAETHVDRSIVGPEPFIYTNVLGTFTLLQAARKFWLQDRSIRLEETRFHQISTDEVYGSLGPADPAFSETSPYSPNSPYAASKASSDHLVRAYRHSYSLPISISNCSNNYGPNQYPEKLIPLVILTAQAGKPLPVYGDGQQIRDWLNVLDHCEAIHKILMNGKLGETYNIGGGNPRTNLAVVETICEMLDELQPSGPVPHRQLIQFVADRPGHDQRYAMDITKIQNELVWQPRYSLEDGLRATVEWYLSHPEWVTAIRAQPNYRQWLEENYAKRVTPA